MRSQNTIKGIRDLLTEKVQSKYFEILYERRCVDERISSTHGIRVESDVSVYAEALDDAYEELVSWGFDDYVRAEGKRGVVLVFDLSLLSPLSHGLTVPVRSDQGIVRTEIFLPSSRQEVSRTSELSRMRSTAIHECFHTFQHRYHSLVSPAAGDWAWADEAAAVFLERHMTGEVQHYLEFALRWCDRPESGLENPSAAYSNAAFLCYLVKQLGEQILPKWYEQGHPFDGLVQVLEQHGKAFIAENLEEEDFFCHGYCVSAWFLSEWLPDVAQRYQARMVSEHFRVQPGRTMTSQPAFLEPLGCRYYRVSVPKGTSAVRVTRVSGAARYFLVRLDARGARQSKAQEASLSEVRLNGATEAVLVVVNVSRERDTSVRFSVGIP